MNRNTAFPLVFDIFIGDTWVSTFFQDSGLSIPEQITRIELMKVMCLSYYQTFLNPDHGLFLNNHDLENICSLLCTIHPNIVNIIGRRYVFFYYNNIVASYGHLNMDSNLRDFLMERMNNLDLLASTHLDPDHRYYQEPP